MSNLTAAVCVKLQEQGLKIYPSTNIVFGMMYRGPVFINQHCMVLRSKIDAYSSVNLHTMCVTSHIGRYCSIGEHVRLGMGQHDISEVSTCKVFSESKLFAFAGFKSERLPAYRQQRNGEETTNVTLGHDVWVGANVLFPSDVKVGHGAVIGAGAIVTKDVPPYAVVVGTNKIVRYRFSDELISDMLELQWWNYDIPKMLQQGVDLPMDKPQEFISRFKELDPAKLLPLDDKWYFLEVPNAAEPLNTVQLHPVDEAQSLYYDPREQEAVKENS